MSEKFKVPETFPSELLDVLTDVETIANGLKEPAAKLAEINHVLDILGSEDLEALIESGATNNRELKLRFKKSFDELITLRNTLTAIQDNIGRITADDGNKKDKRKNVGFI